MDFGKQLEVLFDKIEKIKLYYSIMINREQHTEDLRKLQDALTVVEPMLTECQKRLKEWPALKADMQEKEEQMQRYKQFTLRALELMEDLPKEQKVQHQPTPRLNSFTPESVLRERNYQTPGSYQIRRVPQSILKTPSSIMQSGRKAKSPFVYREPINPHEFEFCLTNRQFDGIPKYMRGRDNIDDLQSFLNGVISPCLCQKYTLMCHERSRIPMKDRNLFDIFYEQEKDFPNKKFITVGDISRFLGTTLDRRTNSRIQMLRHIKVLQEVRKKSSVYLIWLPILVEE